MPTVTADDLHIDYEDPRKLKDSQRNARKHSGRQITQLVGSIREFSFTNPILVDEKGVIIAGHARREAAISCGLKRVPIIVIRHLTEQQKRALMLADNKLALNASWDLDLLKEELIELSSADTDFDISVIGFETVEIDLITGEPDEKADPIDRIDAIDRSVPAVSQAGDAWVLGAHRLYCGSALESASFRAVMQGDEAEQVITDPPYNVPVDGHVGGLGKSRHREFAMASGEMSQREFTSFLASSFSLIAAHCADGAMVMAFMDWRHLEEILGAGKAAQLELKNLCVWDKINGGMGSLYRSQHELILVFKYGMAPHVNNVELGRHGRYRTNVWRYAGASMFRRGRKKDLETHPTVKPIAMIMDAIKDCSHRGGIILDPFGGSGTTLLAAERTGRRARLIEIDPYYVDATVRRWEKLTGGQGVDATGRTFNERSLAPPPPAQAAVPAPGTTPFTSSAEEA